MSTSLEQRIQEAKARAAAQDGIALTFGEDRFEIWPGQLTTAVLGRFKRAVGQSYDSTISELQAGGVPVTAIAHLCWLSHQLTPDAEQLTPDDLLFYVREQVSDGVLPELETISLDDQTDPDPNI